MGKKNPKTAFAPTPQKLPSAAVTPLDLNAQRPSWRASNMETAISLLSGRSATFQERLDALGYGDQDRVVSLRLSAKERVSGVMESGVLNVLWWDPDHTVYPVEKKHT